MRFQPPAMPPLGWTSTGMSCIGMLARGLANGSWRKTWCRTPCWRHSSRATDSRAERPFAPGYSPSFGIRSLIIADARQRRFRRPKPIRSRDPTPFARDISARRVCGRRPLASWKAPDQALENREFWDVLDGCLNRLPRSLSSAFILRELEDVDTAEMRRILDLSEVNLRVRLHRARLLLRECLEKHWFIDTPGGSRRTS